MEFRNRTPFNAQAYSALDKKDREYRVVVARVGYALRKNARGRYEAVVLDDEPVDLVMEDRYRGEVGSSSALQESDLAPYKPKCDVLFVGRSYAPAGAPQTRWGCRLQLHARTDAAPDGATVVDKAICVCGPRIFQRGLVGWVLSEPRPAESVELSWEHAFGGSSLVANPAAESPENPLPPLLNEVCFSNPVGRGWMDTRYPSTYELASGRSLAVLPAPQIEEFNRPTQRLVVVRHPAGELDVRKMAEIAAHYGSRPVGMGAVGRSWSSRAPLAGTYDQKWLEQRHPYLPTDFDMRYWNCAPEDQQVDFPTGDFRLEMTNLLPDAVDHGGHVAVQMPGHRAFLLVAFASGGALPMPMVIDTIEVHGDEMRVDVVWRAAVLDELKPRVAELRFEVDPKQPLIKRGTDRAVSGASDG